MAEVFPVMFEVSGKALQGVMGASSSFQAPSTMPAQGKASNERIRNLGARYRIESGDYAYGLRVRFTYPNGTETVHEPCQPKEIVAAEAAGVKCVILNGFMKMMHEW